jgi:NAD(P)-dependent dehydrogenase (short-subunit alcohol dehydrogenase family)
LEENSADNMFSVSGKIVVVTGAASGNGYAIAKGFLSHGAIVVSVDKNDIDEELSNHPNNLSISIDLTDEESLHSLIDKIESNFSRVDVLVNNAGISLTGTDVYDKQVLDTTFRINFQTPFMLCSLICPIMAKNKTGSIINITSLGAELGFPENPAYQASKAALKQFTKSLARDWGHLNIRVNNICPGYIKTPMTEKSYNDPASREERQNRMILNRWGKSDDLVGPCIFLASSASSYITGSDIYVDGGWTAKGL